MFNKLGEKLQFLALLEFWVWVIASVVGGGICICFVSFLLGVLIIVLGVFVSWLSAVVLYTIGEIEINTRVARNLTRVDNTSKNISTTAENSKPSFSSLTKTAPVKTAFDPTKRCPHCGEIVRSNRCDMCNQPNNLYD